jgi:glycerophosphoryl diester phosphodiesterase
MIRLIKRFVWAAGLFASVGVCPAFDFYQPVRPPRPFQVMVHRGMMQQAPENTRPALELAIEDGLEWVEVDIRVTRDGHHILLHDDRLDGKSNGTGPVKNLSLEELLKLDAGSWFAPRFAGSRFLTLDDCLALAKGKINLYLDCKDINPERLVQQILQAGMAGQVVIFDDPETLARVRERSQGKVAIMPKWHRESGLGSWVDKLRPEAVEIDADEVTAEVCKAFHEKGVLVQAKTLGKWDCPEWWERVLTAGVDWVQTDLPEEIIAHALWKARSKHPIRMALHRGACRYAPENTLPAYAKAVRLGADMVEFDVHTTKDGKFYLLHDSKLDRTTNGTGPMRECPSEVVAGLDAGSWFGWPFAGTKIPTLDMFLDAVKGKADLYFDAKDIPPQALAEAVERYGMTDRTVVYQGPAYLQKLKEINPRIRGLAPLSHPIQVSALAEKLKPYAVDAAWKVLSKDLIDRCHAAGMLVFSDAPDDKGVDEYVRAIKWGIDLIQTDYPLRLIRAVELLEAEHTATAPAAAK